jgi:hypothetical protein
MAENIEEKHGQKLFLNAIILRSIKALHGDYAVLIEYNKAQELNHFKDTYKQTSSELFTGARKTCVNHSLEKLRRPEKLPCKMNLQKLKCFIASEIEETIQHFSIDIYAWLRSLTVAKLALFNAKRGEEASRIMLSEWGGGITNDAIGVVCG